MEFRNANMDGNDGKILVAGPQTSMSIDWYSEGQSRTVECGGQTVVIRFVGRKGRRGRIVIVAPAGAVFRTIDRNNQQGQTEVDRVQSMRHSKRPA
jgi:hypothetical protein